VKANAVWIEPDSLAVATRDDETDARSGLERAADWAQIGMLAATVVAVLVAWFQIQGAKRQGRSQRTGQVFDRLNNRDFHIRWSKILTFLKVDGEEECLGRIRREVRVPTGNDPLLPLEGSDSVVLNDIQAAHGLFEEAALLFNDHTLEQDTVIRAFGDSIADAYLSSWWWIHYQRECRDRSIAARWVRKREATAYSEWERMVRTMIDQSPASRADFEAAWGPSPVRAICLPLDDEATDGEWVAAGLLSAAVGKMLRRPRGDHDLEDFLRPQFAPRRHISEPFTPVDRTVLIPPWPELFTLPSRPRRAAVRVGAWWDQRWEKDGGSPAGYRLVRLDPWVATCQRYQEIAWRLEICRRRVGDDDLTRRIAGEFDADE
jgi:hypothetical protein